MDIFLQIGTNTLVTASIYTLLGLAFSFVYSVNRYFDMTLAAYIVLGAYTAYFLQKIGLPTPFAILATLALTACTAYLLEQFYYHKLRHKKATSFIFMIASLGVLTVLQAAIALLFTSNIQTLKTYGLVFHIGSVAFTDVHLVTVLSTAIICIGVSAVMLKTKIGAQLRAISDNEELAFTSGVNIAVLRIGAVAFSAAIVALAGILSGMDASIEPLMGMSLLFKGVIAAFIVGLSSTLFIPLGAIMLAILENTAIWYISGEWKDAIAFFVLILILLIRPRGIFTK
jgi:branched-chain amino acid transport system permease protein